MIIISAQVESRRRIWKFIVYPLLLLTAALFIYLSVSDSMMETDGSPVRVFGTLIAPVHTSGMEPALSQGDAVIIDATPADQIEPGDIIVYRGMDAYPDIARVSSSRELLGVPHFTVQGQTADGETESVPAGYIYGTVSRYIPYAGSLLDFLDTTAGTICCIGLPLLLLILLEIISSIRNAKRQIREKARSEPELPLFPEQEYEAAFSGTPDGAEPVYQGGSFSPQYAYHPQRVQEAEPFPLPPESFEQEEVQEPNVPPQPVDPEPAAPVPDVAAAPEPAQQPPAEPVAEEEASQPQPADKKLSLTLSGDETSEFTVNGINIVYEDDTLNLDVDPMGGPMRIRVRMRDDEAQLLFKAEDKTTRFAILNQEGKPRRISISGKDEEETPRAGS